MKVLPAIDIMDNKCVRLTMGDFNTKKIYSDDPYEMAVRWKNEGAEYLHIVDLNGAIGEASVNRSIIERIIKKTGLPIQVGGGIRTEENVRELIDIGVSRVIVGTIAVENKELLKELVSVYGEKIAVSIDALNGKAALRGWKIVSDEDSIDLCSELEQIGVKTIVYTDIAKDGMLEGPNLDIYRALSVKTSLNIIASGGISSVRDIKTLNSLNIYGVIVGKALYNNSISLKEVLLCLQRE